jgi:anti-anti-sigma factor
MKITTEKREDGMLVTVAGRLDALGAPEFDAAMDKLLAAGERNFIVNLGGVLSLSSAGLRSILLLGRKVAEHHGKLLLHQVGGSVKEVFDISGFSAWRLESGHWVKET